MRRWRGRCVVAEDEGTSGGLEERFGVAAERGGGREAVTGKPRLPRGERTAEDASRPPGRNEEVVVEVPGRSRPPPRAAVEVETSRARDDERRRRELPALAGEEATVTAVPLPADLAPFGTAVAFVVEAAREKVRKVVG